MMTIVRGRLRLSRVSRLNDTRVEPDLASIFAIILCCPVSPRRQLFRARWWKLRWCWRVSQYVRLPALYTFTAFRYLTSAPPFSTSQWATMRTSSRTPTPNIRRLSLRIDRLGSIAIYITGGWLLEWRTTGVFDVSPIAEEAICLAVMVMIITARSSAVLLW